MQHSVQPSGSHDVIVIGGGIIGCSIALKLAQAKLRVLVIDRASALAEASGAAAGMLAPQGEMLEPDPFFEMCMASRDLYASFTAEVESLSGEKAGYRTDGSLLVATDEKETEELDHLYRAQTRLRLPVERWSGDQIRRAVPDLSPHVRCGLFIAGDHWVDNERLLLATWRAAERAGASIHWGAAALGFNRSGGRIESVNARLRPEAEPLPLSAAQFVLAAGCWSGELAATAGVRLSMEPCHGQMMEFESGKNLPFVIRSGMHYLVPRSENRVLAGTTAESTGFEKAVTGKGLRSILEGVSRFAPAAGDFRFRRAWAGLRPDTSDHLPILGRGEPANLVFATGHFRNGILLAPVTAQLIAELILSGTPSRPLEAYSPARFGK